MKLRRTCKVGTTQGAHSEQRKCLCSNGKEHQAGAAKVGLEARGGEAGYPSCVAEFPIEGPCNWVEPWSERKEPNLEHFVIGSVCAHR